MKVALCLSGHFRSFEKAFPSLKRNILDIVEPDIFISTWSSLGFDRSDRGDEHLIETPTNPNRLKELYNPKSMIIEPMRQWDTQKYNHRIGYGNRSPQIIFGMFHGIQSANRLKQNYEEIGAFKYDVVIRSRADLFFESALDKKEVESAAGGDGIYFANFGKYGGEPDQFAFGSSQYMDIYSNTIDNIDHIFNQGLRLHPETMLKANIENHKIPIIDSNIEYGILRANGYLFRLQR